MRFVTPRHAQGDAFMVDVYGRLAGRADVCMATLHKALAGDTLAIIDCPVDCAETPLLTARLEALRSPVWCRQPGLAGPLASASARPVE